MYLFYNICATLHVSKDYFVHYQEFINLLYLQLCTNRTNVSNCSVLRLEPYGLFIELVTMHGTYNVKLSDIVSRRGTTFT